MTLVREDPPQSGNVFSLWYGVWGLNQGPAQFPRHQLIYGDQTCSFIELMSEPTSFHLLVKCGVRLVLKTTLIHLTVKYSYSQYCAIYFKPCALSLPWPAWLGLVTRQDWVGEGARMECVWLHHFVSAHQSYVPLPVYLCQMYDMPDVLVESHGLINHTRWIGWVSKDRVFAIASIGFLNLQSIVSDLSWGVCARSILKAWYHDIMINQIHLWTNKSVP